jgi:hypothetical protein
MSLTISGVNTLGFLSMVSAGCGKYHETEPAHLGDRYLSRPGGQVPIT